MRPAIKHGLLVVWRDQDTLQIGIDPRQAVAVTGMGRVAGLIGLLDGSREHSQRLRRRHASRHRHRERQWSVDVHHRRPLGRNPQPHRHGYRCGWQCERRLDDSERHG